MMHIDNCFAERRKRLLKQIEPNSMAILFAAKNPVLNPRTAYSQKRTNLIASVTLDPDFYYMTGLIEPEAIALFIPNRKEGEYILFSLEQDPIDEKWNGARIGQKKACSEHGVDQAFTLQMANQMIPELISSREKIYFHIYDHDDHEHVMRWLIKLFGKERQGINPPTNFADIGKIIHTMRRSKDQVEIALLKKAAEITADAQIRAMKACRPGMMEFELAAEVSHEFTRTNSGLAFSHIVGGGKNSCILHYMQNDCELRDGELVLLDIGATHKYYPGDVTRTFPVNGRFSDEQKAIYKIVLNTQLEVIKNVRPGVSWMELHKISQKSITKGLVELGLLTGNVNDLLEQEAYKPFYMHYIGHWLGLNTHDVGRYRSGDDWCLLEPGFVLTVEPGIYIDADNVDVNPKWHNIGVRIEDDILVTTNGCEVLSKKAPKEINDIEKLMQR